MENAVENVLHLVSEYHVIFILIVVKVSTVVVVSKRKIKHVPKTALGNRVFLITTAG